jgi:2-C-methyl-D-erythritol 4-phosphate cytidylyltransferase/2-C-methyl-D-erythritol 2,4-cyclodiphosphate synthase
MSAPQEIAVVIVAAGRGERAGSPESGPKQYRRIGGEPVIRHTIGAFAAIPAIGRIVVAIHADDDALFTESAGGLAARVSIVVGGPSRQESTLRALRSLAAEPPAIVLIHDGVRPFIERELVENVIACAESGVGALPAVAVADTLKRVRAGMIATVDRTDLHAAQTPQGFPFAPILAAHEAAASSGRTDFTDDASIAEWARSHRILVSGCPHRQRLRRPRLRNWRRRDALRRADTA